MLFRKLILVIFCLSLAACQSVSTFYQGQQVLADDIIPLPGGTINEDWSNFDLRVTYSYSEDGEKLKMSGTVELSEHYRMNYSRLDNLELYLLFIDHESKVVVTTRLVNRYSGSTSDAIPFSTRFSLPANAVAFAFAYDGIAREHDPENGSISHFWNRPR